MNPVHLFLEATVVVQAVIVLLILCSLWCWAIIFDCTFRIIRLGRSSREGTDSLIGRLLSEARQEASISYVDESEDARRYRIECHTRRRIQEIVERHQGGLATLATISSVAPFIGLFGTVWGIMNSFIGIAASKDTSLAVVAPGIAEALAATAIGLAAAIPAAFFYNRLAVRYTRLGRRLSRQVEDRISDVLYISASQRVSHASR